MTTLLTTNACHTTFKWKCRKLQRQYPIIITLFYFLFLYTLLIDVGSLFLFFLIGWIGIKSRKKRCNCKIRHTMGFTSTIKTKGFYLVIEFLVEEARIVALVFTLKKEWVRSLSVFTNVETPTILCLHVMIQKLLPWLFDVDMENSQSLFNFYGLFTFSSAYHNLENWIPLCLVLLWCLFRVWRTVSQVF